MTRAELDKNDVGSDGLKELARADLPHLDFGHWTASGDLSLDWQLRAAAPGGSLPYELLEPYAFERLCYLCYLPAGEAPRGSGVGAARLSREST